MTKTEAELIARGIRSRCLHSSWSDLVAFWKDVLDNLESAYRAAVRGTAPNQHISSEHSSELQPTVEDKLATALSQLAGEKQVARLHIEAARWNQTTAGEPEQDTGHGLSD
jgi:hypothetical protein